MTALSSRPATAEEVDGLLAALRDADTGASRVWAPPPEYATPDAPDQVWWLHAEQADGYTVGRCDNGTWRLGRAEFAELAAFRPERINELRVFRPGVELVAYRDGTTLRGVWSQADSQPEPGPAEPRAKSLLLVAPGLRPSRDQQSRNGFTRLRRIDGTSAVAPAAWPERGDVRLRVVEHFDRDDATGAVRVAAVRFDSYIEIPEDGHA